MTHHGSVVTGGGDNDGCGDSIGIHAGLRVVVESYEGPVSDHSCDALFALEVFSDDEILDCSSVHENDIRHSEDF